MAFMDSAIAQAQPPIAQALAQQPQASNLSPAERDLMIRTLYGEAGGEGDAGQAAVAHVIKNRLGAGDWGPDLTSVIKAPKQFSLWNPGDKAGAHALALGADDPRYQKLGGIVDGVMSGKIADPTGGADHYYNPHVASPDWGDKLGTLNDVSIGNHRFVGKARNYQGGQQGGGQTSPLSDALAGGGPQADLPAVGAHPVAGNQEPESLWDKFKDGGPGGLFGLPSQRPWDLGSALQGAGIAAMARDNPSGANAMAQIPSMEARAWVPRYATSNFNKETGQYMSTDSRTGKVGVHNAQDQGYKPIVDIPQAEKDEFNTRHEKISEATNAYNELNKVRDAIVNNKVDFSLASHYKGDIQNLLNSSDPNAQAIGNYKHWEQLMQQQIQNLQKGSSSDKRAADALHAFIPEGMGTDNGQILQAIRNIQGQQRALISSKIQANQGTLTIPGADYQMQKGVWSDPKYYQGQLDAMNDYETKAGPAEKAWEDARNAANASKPKMSGGSVANGSGSTGSSQGSFYHFYNK